VETLAEERAAGKSTAAEIGAGGRASMAVATSSNGHVNTKNWYRKGTDLWAEFGNEMPFGRKISLEDSVKILAVGSTPLFGRRTVCA
jgi:hypothetical protein